MATGMAKGAARRGKRIAFGDGKRIIWGPFSKDIFRGNPNVAPPGSERDADLEWIAYYKGNRQYNTCRNGRWIWNYDFRPQPGEIYLDKGELAFANTITEGTIILEPNVPQKTAAINKQWPLERWQRLADVLLDCGHDVCQLQYAGARHYLSGVARIRTDTFRLALAALSRAQLWIGHEGGMHHGAAALDVPAVVIFGAWIPPAVTGYAMHANLTGGATTACGSLRPCNHCRDALDAIKLTDVTQAAKALLS
jgi:ADP-heptose:LPS heptosyltransferase